MIADLIAGVGELQAGVGYLGELQAGVGYLGELAEITSDRLREASNTGQAVGAAAQKDLDAVAALIQQAKALEYASSSKAGAAQAAAVLNTWGCCSASRRSLRARPPSWGWRCR
jgi:hypothetical protein